MTDKKIKKIIKFCGKCYSNFLSGKLFDNYLTGLIGSIEEDLKANPKVESPFKNKELIEQFKEYTKDKSDRITVLLNSPNDMTA